MEVETEVIYQCSSDRGDQLRTSVQSVLDSGSAVDRMRVYLWRDDAAHPLQLSHPKVVVTPVEPLYGEDTFANTVYSSWSDAPRVVYLDTDTIVLRPLEELWRDRGADVLARVGTVYERRVWKQDIWEETFARHGAPVVPIFNTGVVVFQNGVQPKLRDLWARFTRAYLEGEETLPWYTLRLRHQLALSLAVGVTGVEYELFTPKDQAFGWMHESYDEAVVLHTGNDRYGELVAELVNAGQLSPAAT